MQIQMEKLFIDNANFTVCRKDIFTQVLILRFNYMLNFKYL